MMGVVRAEPNKPLPLKNRALAWNVMNQFDLIPKRDLVHENKKNKQLHSAEGKADSQRSSTCQLPTPLP